METTDFERHPASIQFGFNRGEISVTVDVTHDGARFVVVTERNTWTILPPDEQKKSGDPRLLKRKRNDPFESHKLWMDQLQNVVDYVLLSCDIGKISARLLTPPEDGLDAPSKKSTLRLQDWIIEAEEASIKKVLSLLTHVKVVSYGRLPPKKKE